VGSLVKLKMKDDVDVEEKEEYISRELGAILINYETSKYYETNDTGTFIIKFIQENKTVEEMVVAICKEYKVDEATALKDLNVFIDRLKELEFLED